MRRLLPPKFEIRERILFGVAVALAGVALFFIYTAALRHMTSRWIDWQFLGTVLFVSIAVRDRAYFTGLYCTMLSGTKAIMFAYVLVFRHHWSGWPNEVMGSLLIGFFLFLSVTIPIAFAWSVTRLVAYLERRIYK